MVRGSSILLWVWLLAAGVAAEPPAQIPLDAALSKLPMVIRDIDTLTPGTGIPRTAWYGPNSWAVRYSVSPGPDSVWKISGVSVGIWSRSGGEICSVFVFDDFNGLPAYCSEAGAFTCLPGAYLYELILRVHTLEVNEFWVGVKLPTLDDSIFGLYVLADSVSSLGTSFYTEDYLAWEPLPEGNLCIRTLGHAVIGIGVDEEWQGMAGFDAEIRAETELVLSVPAPMDVSISVYDVQGRLVSEPLSRTTLPSGRHRLDLGIRRLPSGAYLIGVEADGGVFRRLLKFLKVR
jgi:hypothetical protein